MVLFRSPGFEGDFLRDGSADSHGRAHKSKKKKKDKKHKKHKKHKHEHKDKLDKLDKFIQEENLSSGSSNPPSPPSPGSMGGSVSNSMASNMSFWAARSLIVQNNPRKCKQKVREVPTAWQATCLSESY